MPKSTAIVKATKSESIDERLLRLLGLEEYEVEMDYDTYIDALREAAAAARMGKQSIPTDEAELITEEFKRVKGKKGKGRFKVKKKKISAQSLSSGNKKALPAAKMKALPPGSAIKGLEENISAITNSVVSIASIMRQQAGLDAAAAAQDRKQDEQDKRAVAESKLEKGFKGLKKAAEKIIAPVKNILDRVMDFFVKIFFGRVIFKLLEWFGDPKNQSKVNSIIRFLGDHWPKLLALYLTFGTGIGKAVRFLISTLARGTALLVKKLALLAAAKGVGGARKFARMLGGKKVGTAINIGATALTLIGANSLLGGGGGENKEEQPKTQGLRGGGYVRPRFPTFSGGGFNAGKMFGGAMKGAVGGPIGMLLGALMGGGNGSGGFVSGEKGVDKVPAMLSDGEFVMSTGAVEKYGVDTLESMNAAGGGTNIPKMMSGVAFAAGGGLIDSRHAELMAQTKPEKIRAYDKTHGEGAYAEKLRQKLTKIYSSPSKSTVPVNAQLAADRAAGILNRPATPTSKTTTTITGDKPRQSFLNLTRSSSTKSTTTTTTSSSLSPEMQAKLDQDKAERERKAAARAREDAIQKKGRDEYMKIINDFNHPDYDKAFNNEPGYSLDDFIKKARASAPPAPAAATPTQAKAAVSAVKPLAGKAKQPMTEAQKIKAASQARLNKLSYEGKGKILSGRGRGARRSKGKRFDAEEKARMAEFKSRGGVLGQMNRSFTGMLDILSGGKSRYEEADKASQARVKQAGAEAIGRYYSSSDGKYYKDYAAAKKARDLRLADQQKKTSAVKPLPPPAASAAQKKAQDASRKRNNRRGSGMKAKGVPNFSASGGASSPKKQLMGVK